MSKPEDTEATSESTAKTPEQSRAESSFEVSHRDHKDIAWHHHSRRLHEIVTLIDCPLETDGWTYFSGALTASDVEQKEY